MASRNQQQGELEGAKGVHVIPLGPRVVEVLDVAYRARRAVLLEGVSGIGKSEIVSQSAERLGIDIIVVDLTVLEPSDLVGIPQVVEGRTRYAPPNWLPRGGAGILMIEELNRSERHMQQPALQLLSARRLHEYVLPPDWTVVAAINPEDGDYQVNPLDPALRNRFLHVPVRADRDAWLTWAEANTVHPAVIEVVRHHDQAIFDVPPRSWTYASSALRAMEEPGPSGSAVIYDVLGGYLPGAWLELVLQHGVLAKALGDLSVATLLRRFHERTDLQEALAQLREAGRTDRLEQIYRQLHAVLSGPDLERWIREREIELEALEAVLQALPGDMREGLQEAFGGNPASAQLLPVQPEQVLGRYRRSLVQRQVKQWVTAGGLDHRLRALVSALAEHVRTLRGGGRTLRRQGTVEQLRQFVDDVGAERADELVAALISKGVDLDVLF